MKWVTPKTGFDEVFDARGQARPHYAALISILESFTKEDVERRERLQQLTLRNQGITFTVYGEKEGLERIFPFDFVPRIIPAAEWKGIQDGLVQRITTLNLFLADIYGEQKCLQDRVIPAELILSRKEYALLALLVRHAGRVVTQTRPERLGLVGGVLVPGGVGDGFPGRPD